MALSHQDIGAEWSAALADAGIDQSATRLYLARAMGLKHIGAVWHPPSDELVVDERFPDPSQLDDANADEHRRLHRIVVPAELEDVVTFAALLRHELEHARQHDAWGRPIVELQRLIERHVLRHKAGGLDGCAGQLINAVPTEIDANAAASVYVSARFSKEDVARLQGGKRSALACSLLPPESTDTLPARMLAFAFVHRSAFIAYADERGWDLAEMLDGYFGDGASDLWARLESGLTP
jgi:hypothetical protein